MAAKARSLSAFAPCPGARKPPALVQAQRPGACEDNPARDENPVIVSTDRSRPGIRSAVHVLPHSRRPRRACPERPRLGARRPNGGPAARRGDHGPTIRGWKRSTRYSTPISRARPSRKTDGRQAGPEQCARSGFTVTRGWDGPVLVANSIFQWPRTDRPGSERARCLCP